MRKTHVTARLKLFNGTGKGDSGMSNYSILQKNTLDGFSESAGILYLKMLDVFQQNERKSFLVACRYEDKCAGVLDYIMRNMPNAPDAETRQSLSQFFAKRWRHNFMEAPQ